LRIWLGELARKIRRNHERDLRGLRVHCRARLLC
jgi:hypothetical protein